MPISQGTVGPITASDGATPQGGFRQGPLGDAIQSGLHGRYYEQTYRGNCFSATNQAAQAVSVALTATYTGLCVSNPLGNTKNLVLLGAGYALSVAPVAIASIHLIAGYSATTAVTHTAALATPGIRNGLIGTGPTSTASADTQATIVNPYYLVPLMAGFTAGALPASPLVWVDLGGQFVIPPGGWVALGALTAVTGFAGLSWEEVAV